MGKKMVYRTHANQIKHSGVGLRERARIVALRAGNLVPLSLTCAEKLLVEPHAREQVKANAAKRIIALGELDELFDALPKVPFHMQVEVAQRIILRIERDIGREDNTPVDGLYRRKTTTELRNKAKEDIRKLIEKDNISIEAKKTFEEFLAQ